MNFQSVTTLFQEAKKTFIKFPLTIIAGIIIAIAGVTLTEAEYYYADQYDNNYETRFFLTKEERSTYWNIILTLIFSIPLLAGIQISSDKNKLGVAKTTILKLIAVGLAACFYFFVTPQQNTFWLGTESLTAILLISSAFLTLTFLPFFKSDTILNFWKYNKYLIKNLALALFFAAVLFGGIALILFSIDELFEIQNFNEDIYLDAWIIIASIFGPWIFLGNFSKAVENIDKQSKISKFIRIFGQYILIPLLFVFAIILYIYAGKILITQEWPQGIVSGLVIGFAIAGMITHIILYPFEKEFSWIKKAQKTFYILLLPQIAMLFTAIYLRISDYGITENRYYIVLLGLWLIGMAFYFLFSKKQNLKYIPVSVTIIIVLSLFGPWSSFNISEADQLKRLESLLEDKLPLPETKKYQLRSILSYLVQNHGTEKLTPLIDTKKLPENFKELDVWEQENKILQIFGVNDYYYDYHPASEYNLQIQYKNKDMDNIKVSGYDYIAGFYISIYGKEDTSYLTIFDTNSFRTSLQNNIFTVYEESKPAEPITFDIGKLVTELVKNKSLSWGSTYLDQEELITENENSDFKIKLLIRYINAKETDKTIAIQNIEGRMLIKVK
ncbi:DUF4153 domain-containing protein [Candidatus Peregrinibacteria bacterium]|nr:DUF4153 domain-containing protein [Candidatus Peregrinibacteria bacterium]